MDRGDSTAQHHQVAAFGCSLVATARSIIQATLGKARH